MADHDHRTGHARFSTLPAPRRPIRMAVLPVRLFGDPVLRTAADPVTSFDERLARVVDDLTDTVRHADGAGLAAPQIGISSRVFVYDCGGRSGHRRSEERRVGQGGGPRGADDTGSGRL